MNNYQRPHSPFEDSAIERLRRMGLTSNRKQFAPYLDKLGSDQEIEKLFQEFLQERYQAAANT